MKTALEFELELDMELLTFRKIVTDDDADLLYDDGTTWSRIYEYPLVLKELKAHHPHASTVHNSSWGFLDIHALFKNKLDAAYDARHSDLRPSELPHTFVYDITHPAADEEIGRYDVVINVSTMEEVDADHWQCFQNLYAQVKPGGLFVATFDLPGLQLPRFEAEFNQRLAVSGTAVHGNNSLVRNRKYRKLTCGIMTLRKSQ